MSTNSSKGSFINTVSLAVQPFASVTVTVITSVAAALRLPGLMVPKAASTVAVTVLPAPV